MQIGNYSNEQNTQMFTVPRAGQQRSLELFTQFVEKVWRAGRLVRWLAGRPIRLLFARSSSYRLHIFRLIVNNEAKASSKRMRLATACL